jgi:hypothetical protein
MVAAGLLAIPATIQFEKPAKALPVQKPTDQPGNTDLRSTRLRQFFCSLHCPIQDLADDFVEAADDNRLDWRLLPSISVIESGGGKVFKNNNLFGWDNGLQPFQSIRAGIHHVAFKLGKSALYRNQDALGKLKLYNPSEEYAGKVAAVMQMISPAENVVPVRSNLHRNTVLMAVN